MLMKRYKLSIISAAMRDIHTAKIRNSQGISKFSTHKLYFINMMYDVVNLCNSFNFSPFAIRYSLFLS